MRDRAVHFHLLQPERIASKPFLPQELKKKKKKRKKSAGRRTTSSLERTQLGTLKLGTKKSQNTMSFSLHKRSGPTQLFGLAPPDNRGPRDDA